MLITTKQLNAATKLNVAGVRAALARGGEPDADNEIEKVKFQGYSASGYFVYEISYPGEGKKLEKGNVYLKFVAVDGGFELKGTN